MMKFSTIVVFALTVAAVNSRRNPTTLAPCAIPGKNSQNSLPCGTFVAYDIDQPNIVTKHGFSAGTYRDGSKAYVGHAINAACSSEQNCPARLKVTGDGQGGYMACQNIHHDTVGLRFLLNHPDLKWIKTSTNDLFSVPNLVRVRSTHTYKFHIGRKNLTESDGSVFTVVSKVYGNNVLSYSMGGGHTEVGAGDFEVLSC